MVDFLPTSERQARPLASLEPEEQIEAWKRALTSTPEGKITAAIVLKAAQVVENVYLSTQILPMSAHL